MTQLDRYLFRQAGVPFLLILVCTTAVVWLTQVLQRVDLMVEDGGSLLTFLKVTMLLVPSLVGVIVPFALLGAVLFAMNTLAVDNELPVIGAAGGSRMRMARPILALSVLASLIVLAVNADLQPRSYRQLKETVAEVRSDLARSLIRTGVFTEVMGGVTIYADEVRPGDQYVGLLIHDERDPLKARTYTAEKGLFRMTRAGPRLQLARGTWQDVDRTDGSVAIYQYMETSVDLATFEREPGEREIEGTERYIGELLSPDLNGTMPIEEQRAYIAEGHARLATPLYAVAFGLIAAAGFLTASVARSGYGRRILTLLALAIGLRALGFVVQSAAAATPALNAVQYLVPVAASLAAAALIAGRFWTVRTRRKADARLFQNMNLRAAS